MERDNDVDRKPPVEKITVWYQLIFSDEKPSRPSSVVVDSTTNMDDLCDEIKNKNPDLKDIPARKLEVYPPGTRFDDNWNPKDGRTAHDPWDTVPQVKFSGSVPQPLIVVAPKVAYDSSHQVSFVFVV